MRRYTPGGYSFRFGEGGDFKAKIANPLQNWLKALPFNFRLQLEKLRRPGNSFCSSAEICSKTLLPHASLLAVSLIFFTNTEIEHNQILIYWTSSLIAAS